MQPRYETQKKILYKNINIATNYDIFIARNIIRVKLFINILRNLPKYDILFYKWIITRFNYFIKNFFKEFFNPCIVYEKY